MSTKKPASSSANIAAANIRALMLLAGHNQVSLAKRSGVDQKTISNVVRSETEATLGTLEALAAALGVQPWTLLVRGLHGNEQRARAISSILQWALRADPASLAVIAQAIDSMSQSKG